MDEPGRDLKYQVALSYAGQDRPYVKRVYDYLAALDISVFYDRADPTLLWGRNLTEELNRIYEHESATVVIFASRDYLAKDWTRHERRSALSRAARTQGTYVLIGRFHDVELPGVPSDVVYLPLGEFTPEEFGELLVRTLRNLGVVS